MTRLQARISSMGRSAERQILFGHAASLPALQTLTDPPAPSLTNAPSYLPASDLLQTSSTGSSVDFPPSLKATLIKPPWESSSPSASFPETADLSWQGLSAAEASASSDSSFNPLTYMVDRDDVQQSESRRESESTLVGQEEEEDMGSLTGMLKFVHQTLALQEDPSVWSSGTKTQS